MLEFKDRDINKPLIGNILLRTDQGALTVDIKLPNKLFIRIYLAFNPGNSGGPILM